MRLLLCAAAMASIVTAPVAMGADTLYKWVDKNGNVTYQDEPPPADSAQVKTMVEATGAAVQSAAPNVNVVLYSVKVCDACDLVRHVLQERGVPFTEKNAEGDLKVQDELKKVAGVLSVPVVTIGDEVLVGYNKGLMLKDLEDAGFSTTAKTQGQKAGQQKQQATQGQQDEQGQQGQQAQQEGQQGADQSLTPEENALFQENQKFAVDDPFLKLDQPAKPPNDITDLQEIPKDEQIKVNQ